MKTYTVETDSHIETITAHDVIFHSGAVVFVDDEDAMVAYFPAHRIISIVEAPKKANANT